MFYIVGPTAVGKSELAAAAASSCDGEIVSADAFQVYQGLDLLTAKPDEATLGSVRHHLIGTNPLTELMNAEKFRQAAVRALRDIHARDKRAFIVGGTGMYVRALTDGLSPLPSASRELREQLNACHVSELMARLAELDPETAQAIDQKNKHRVLRAVEICLLTGRPASAQRKRTTPSRSAGGLFLFRDRPELYERINFRVEQMFAHGVVEEVRTLKAVGATAAKTLGLEQIRALLAGKVTERDCIASIQQETRRYAKRQLTWFQRQTNFEPLNLSHQGSSEAIELIARKARLSFAQQDD